MRLLVFFLLLAYPLLELALLIKAGGVIGVWATLGIIFATGMLGVWVLSWQGLDTMRAVQRSMGKGEPPILPMIEGAMTGLAGMLLLAPGLITDTLGLLLLVPPLRHLAARTVASRMTVFGSVRTRSAHSESTAEEMQSEARPTGSRSRPIVIEGEFERLDERPMDVKRKPNGRAPDP